MSPPNPPALPDSLRAFLVTHGASVLPRFERFVANALAPCVYITSERVAERPLRRNPLARAVGAQPAAPVLGPTASKFGGSPYATAANPLLPGHRFLGQVNLADVPHLPPLAPREGLLAVDLTGDPAVPRFARARFYPRVDARDVVDLGAVAVVGAWEAAMRFYPGWSLLRDEGVDAELLAEDEVLRDAVSEWAARGCGAYPPGTEDCHQLFGHGSWALTEGGTVPGPDGGPLALADVEVLLRLTYDGAAGFDWGSNALYLLVRRDDLRHGHLERAWSVMANC